MSVTLSLTCIIDVFHEHREVIDERGPRVTEDIHILFGDLAGWVQ